MYKMFVIYIVHICILSKLKFLCNFIILSYLIFQAANNLKDTSLLLNNVFLSFKCRRKVKFAAKASKRLQ